MFKKLLGTILIGLALVGNVIAADGTWTNLGGNKLWSTAGNWAASTIASGASATAYFTNATGVTVTNTYSTLTNCNFFFTNANYTLSGGTNILAGSSGTSTWTVANSRVATIFTKLTGINTINKLGAGTLTLNGDNTYSGGTILGAGVIILVGPTALGDTNNNITFATNATLNMATGTPLTWGTGTVTIATGATATFQSGAGGKYFNGPLVGNGSLVFANTTSLAFQNTNNTFTGPISLTTGGTTTYGFEIYSIGDATGAGTISMDLGTFRWFGVAPIILTNRQFALSGTTSGGLIQANNTASNPIQINKALAITGAGSKTITLCGTSTATNIFKGAITNGSGSTILFRKLESGTWALGGTNTYTGGTTLSGGNLIFQGKQALPNGSTIIRDTAASTLTLLDDGAGVISYGNDLTNAVQNVNTYVFVGNNSIVNGGTNSSSTASNSTISMGTFYFYEHTDVYTRTLNVTGTNNYRIKFNGAVLYTQGGQTIADGRDAGIVLPTTAPCELSGTIIQRDGKLGYDVARRAVRDYLTLDGTSTQCVVSGNILDANDYTSGGNPTATPLGVAKQGTGTWTLSGTNTYSGATRVLVGSLALTSSNTLPYVTDLYLSTGTTNILNFTGTNKIKALYLNNVLQPNGTYGTNGVTYTNTTYFTGNGILEVGQYTNASTFFWTNSLGGNWSVNDNWTNTTTVTNYAPVSSSNNILNFVSSGTKTLTNDILGKFMLNDMNFSNGTYTLVGNTLVFTNGAEGSTRINIQDSVSQIINNTIVINEDSSLIIGGNGSGNLNITNIISGGGSIIKTNSGILSIGGLGTSGHLNSFTGGFTLYTGIVSIPSAGNTAFGTGPLNINGGTIDVSGNNMQTLNNSVYNFNNNFAITTSGGNTFNFGTGNISLGTNVVIASSISTINISNNITDAGNTYRITFAGNAAYGLAGTNSSYSGKTIIQSNAVVSLTRIANVGGGNSSLGAPTTSANGTIDMYDNSSIKFAVPAASWTNSDRVINIAGNISGSTNTIQSYGNDMKVVLTSPILLSGTGSKNIVLTAGQITVGGGDRSILQLDGAIGNMSDNSPVSVLMAHSMSSSGQTNNIILNGNNTFTGSLILSNVTARSKGYDVFTGTLQTTNIYVGASSGTASNIFVTSLSTAVPSSATVNITSNGQWNLNFTGTNIIRGLITNGVACAYGTYGTNGVTTIDTARFSGNGIILVLPYTPPGTIRVINGSFETEWGSNTDKTINWAKFNAWDLDNTTVGSVTIVGAFTNNLTPDGGSYFTRFTYNNAGAEQNLNTNVSAGSTLSMTFYLGVRLNPGGGWGTLDGSRVKGNSYFKVGNTYYNTPYDLTGKSNGVWYSYTNATTITNSGNLSIGFQNLGVVNNYYTSLDAVSDVTLVVPVTSATRDIRKVPMRPRNWVVNRLEKKGTGISVVTSVVDYGSPIASWSPATATNAAGNWVDSIGGVVFTNILNCAISNATPPYWRFPAVGGIMQAGNVMQRTNTIGVSLWGCTSNNTMNSTFISHWPGGSQGSYLMFMGEDTGDGKVVFLIRQTDDNIVRSPASAVLTNGVFYYFAGVADGSKVRLYVNGSEVGSGTAYNGTIATNSSTNLCLGVLSGAIPYQLYGGISDVQFFTNLTTTQITNIYIRGRR